MPMKSSSCISFAEREILVIKPSTWLSPNGKCCASPTRRFDGVELSAACFHASQKVLNVIKAGIPKPSHSRVWFVRRVSRPKAVYPRFFFLYQGSNSNRRIVLKNSFLIGFPAFGARVYLSSRDVVKGDTKVGANESKTGLNFVKENSEIEYNDFLWERDDLVRSLMKYVAP